MTRKPDFGSGMPARFAIGAAAAAALSLAGLAGQQPPAQPPPSQPQEISTVIRSEAGAPSRFAVPDFIAASNDAETVSVAKTIAQVLWDDFNFEREFSMIPRDTYASIPRATSFDDVPFDRWHELGADGVVIGIVQKASSGVRVQVRLFEVASRKSAFGQEYSGGAGSARLYAHTISDEIHMQQRQLKGVARTKLAFDSDRTAERMGGTVEHRDVKEIFISDYDGENQRQVTTNRSLNITASWSPDGRSIAYTSYRRGLPNIFISNIYQGTMEELTKNSESNFSPAWSPDGSRVCFWSNRTGNPEIFIANRDGSNVRQLTRHPALDSTCTWSPSGNEIAFVSDRTGSPQIYVMSADGLNVQKITSESYCDRPTWSPAPYNEIAYTSRTGPGLDIKVMDMTTKQVRQLTFGEGSNESPSWAPNGRHLTFVSTRSGKTQVFTIARDGKDIRQITRIGSNYMPDWSK
jgi:TolB protein